MIDVRVLPRVLHGKPRLLALRECYIYLAIERTKFRAIKMMGFVPDFSYAQYYAYGGENTRKRFNKSVGATPTGLYLEVTYSLLGAREGNEESVKSNLESAKVPVTNNLVNIEVYYATPNTIAINIHPRVYTLRMNLTNDRSVVGLTASQDVRANILDLKTINVIIQPGEGIEFMLLVNIRDVSIPSVSMSLIKVVYGIGAGLELQSPQVQCPVIRVFANLETLYGGNLSRVVFRSASYEGGKVREHMHRPKFTRAVAGKGRTLQEKVLTLGTGLMNGIVSYGLLRYYLWYLITMCWDTTILYQSNTSKFFDGLKWSEYKCWIEAFQDPQIKGYDEYFVNC